MENVKKLSPNIKKRLIETGNIEELQEKCEQGLIKMKDFKKYLKAAYIADTSRFEKITTILKDSYSDFDKISFPALYQEALLLDPYNYYKLQKLGYLIDYDSLLVNTLKGINRTLSLTTSPPASLFRILDDVVENYNDNKKSIQIIKNIEAFPTKVISKHIQYDVLNDIYLTQHPQNPDKLRKSWLHGLITEIYMDVGWTHQNDAIIKHKKYNELKDLVKQLENNTDYIERKFGIKNYPWLEEFIKEVNKEMLKEKLALELKQNLETNLNNDRIVKVKAKI